MKRFTSFLTTMLLLMVALPSFAQLEELKNVNFTVGNPIVMDEFQTDTWYVIYNERGGTPGYMYDGGAGTQVLRYNGSDAFPTEEASADVYGKFLVRFLPGEAEDGYFVQFGTGNYVIDDSTPKTSDNEYDACNWTVNLVDLTGENQEMFFFNVWTEDYSESTNLHGAVHLGSRIDCNASNICYWETGNISSEYGCDTLPTDKGNYRWYIYTVELTQSSEIEALYSKVSARFNELYEYYDTFVTGTEPGCYGEAEVQAFYDALDYVANTLDDPEYVPTVESLQAMLDNMNSTYEAVLASLIVFNPATGYYRLTTTMEYYETTEDTEDPETGEIIPGETVYPTKAMYAQKDRASWKTLDESDCTFLWRFDKDEETGNYKVYNAAYENRFEQVSQSSTCEMSDLDAVESEMYINYVARNEETGLIQVSFRRADQSGDYVYVHQGGHASGAGKSGDCVGWTATAGASTWYMIPVDEVEAQRLIDDFAPIKDHEKLVVLYDSILAAAKADLIIAEDIAVVGDPIVTDASQFSSSVTEPSEGSIEALIDGDASTFWHSIWSNGNATQGTHFLQVDLGAPYETGLAMQFMRRNVANDQTTDFSLYGYDSEPDVDATAKEDGQLLGHFYFNDGTKGTLFTSNAVTFEGAYQYIRVYSEVTDVNRGYWHAAEINFLQAAANENAQYKFMGELYTNLVNVIADQADLTDDDIDIDAYNALKAAYDAFLTKFVDPTELRAAIAAAEPKLAVVVEGTDPGYWPAESSAASMKQLLADAQTYDASGDYNPTTSANYTEQLNTGVENLFAEAIGITTGKWYQLGFLTERQYDDLGWDTSTACEVYDSDDDKACNELFGTVAGPAIPVKAETGYNFPETVEIEDVIQGQALYLVAPEDFTDEAATWFRFVSVGDTAYVIQNKATGLFIRAAGTSGGTTLDIHPSLFTVAAMGGGANLVQATTVDGEFNSYLHGQQSGSVFVTWNNTAIGCNSAIAIHEVGDVTEEPATAFNKSVEDGQLYAVCYPVAQSATEGAAFYTFKGVSEDFTQVILSPATEVAAGQPAVLIVDGEYGTMEEDEENIIVLNHGMDIVAAPATENGFTGLYVKKSVGKGKVVASGKGGMEVTKKSANSVAANSAYVDNGAPVAVAAESDVVVELGGTYTTIEQTLNAIATNGAIYSIDGKHLGNGNLNTVRGMGAGLYIVNGVKVLVK